MDAPSTDFALVLQILTTLRSPLVHTVELVFWFKLSDGEPISILDAFEWDRLDHELSKQRFSSLHRFRIDIFPSCDFLTTDYFTSRLPKLNKRNVIFSPALQLRGKKPNPKGKQREVASDS